MKRMQDKKRARGGLTLVELLVVITILVLLVGVVLPLAQPALEGREIREATRLVNTVFAGAKARSTAEGRPLGIILTPTQGTTDRCYQLAFAKVPPPYAGDDETWRAGFRNSGTGTDVTAVQLNNNAAQPYSRLNDPLRADDNFVGELTFTSNDLVVPPTILARLVTEANPVFTIRLNHREPTYKAMRVGNTFLVALPSNQINQLPRGSVITLGNGGTARGGAPFRIRRSPRRSMTMPVDLPLGTYIDLSASGFLGDQETLTDKVNTAGGSVAIMFDVDGRVDQIVAGSQVVEARADLFLLLANGKTSGPSDATGNPITDPTIQPKAFPNLAATAGSLWAIVDRQTGNVRTTDNLGFTTAIQSKADLYSALNQARLSARSGSNKGGR